jgi:hypothetical protein
MRLDMLITHARNERLIPVRQSEDLKRRPELGVLHGRGDAGRRRAVGEERERRGEQLFVSSREARGEDGEEVRVEVDDVGGRDRVA